MSDVLILMLIHLTQREPRAPVRFPSGSKCPPTERRIISTEAEMELQPPASSLTHIPVFTTPTCFCSPSRPPSPLLIIKAFCRLDKVTNASPFQVN